MQLQEGRVVGDHLDMPDPPDELPQLPFTATDVPSELVVCEFEKVLDDGGDDLLKPSP